MCRESHGDKNLHRICQRDPCFYSDRRCPGPHRVIQTIITTSWGLNITEITILETKKKRANTRKSASKTRQQSAATILSHFLCPSINNLVNLLIKANSPRVNSQSLLWRMNIISSISSCSHTVTMSLVPWSDLCEDSSLARRLRGSGGETVHRLSLYSWNSLRQVNKTSHLYPARIQSKQPLLFWCLVILKNMNLNVFPKWPLLTEQVLGKSNWKSSYNHTVQSER